MRFSLWPAPGVPWPELLELALHAERTGWDGLWVADHFMPASGDLHRPVNECWTTLAALAARVPRLRLGSLVAANTVRHPAVLAKMAAGVDVVSQGRLTLGLGAGWQENEHRAYGIPLGRLGERLDRLEEACAIVRSLLEEERTTFAGRHYRLEDAVLEPKPVQRPLPLLVGGGGERRTLRIAARHAHAWNDWGTPERIAHKLAVLDRHCLDVGRDPAAIRRTAVARLLLVDDPAEAARRAASGPPALAGDAGLLREALGRYAALGVDEFVVPLFEAESAAARRARFDRLDAEVVRALR